MATKTRGKASRSTRSDWKTDWPESGDLRQWLLCWVRKCEVHDPDERWHGPRWPIEELAKIGEVEEALQQVDRLLELLPPFECVLMAEQGAAISDEAGDAARRERYLGQIAAMDPQFRRAGSTFIPNVLRKFRAEHGLLDPQDAIDDEERNLAAYTRARRRFRDGRGNAKTAALAEMERLALKTTDFYEQDERVTEIIKLHVEQGNAANVQRLIKQILKPLRDEVLERPTLSKLGLKREAIARSKREIAKRRMILAGADPSEYRFGEFQIRAICREIVFLAEQRQKPLARREFAQLLRNAKSRQILEAPRGKPTLAQFLADTVSAIDGPKAARAFLEAQQAAGKKGRIWKEISFDEALAQARKIRSPAKQRFKLVALLVAADRWQDLRKVVSGAATLKEARELCSLVVGDLQ